MRRILILCACLLAWEAHAVTIDSIVRETSYSGGLEQPNMMGDSVVSTALGSFDEAFSENISSAGYGDAGAGVSQTSSVDLSDGTLTIQLVSADSNVFATSLASGAITDGLAWNEFEVMFTASENVLVSMDLFISSELAVFYDGPGVGVVETSNVGSILFCEVGGGCFVDLLVDDVTDNGLAASDGVLDSAWFPPGQYVVELLAVSQTISRDVGSAAGAAGFWGEITVQPAPEPGQAAILGAGLALLVVLRAGRRRNAARGAA